MPDLARLAREPLTTPEGTSLNQMLKRFKEARKHMAIVLDEYGGAEGIVTMEDVIETLLGLEIVDESDRVEDMQQLARRNWEQRARALGLTPPEPPPAADPDDDGEPPLDP